MRYAAILGRWPPGGLLAALLRLPAAAPAATVPELQFHSGDRFAGLAERLEGFDPEVVLRTLQTVGLDDPGPPIPVVLAEEGSLAARRAPSWGVGYATDSGQVVLLPSRVPGYPDQSLETVLYHEVAHVLIDRAAGGRPVPRWFHEGLALHCAREWGWEDRGRLLWATLRGRESALARLDEQFAGGALRARRAYAFAAAFVRFLLDRHGPDAPARILAGLAADKPFDAAFEDALGQPLAAAETSFFRHLDLWNKWIPVVTSSGTLWILITLLAIYAIKRRRDRDAEILARWDEEEHQRWLAEQPTDGWVN
jgi:hypothetical protein